MNLFWFFAVKRKHVRHRWVANLKIKEPGECKPCKNKVTVVEYAKN